MGSTFSSLYYHVVFSTKHRRPLIAANWCAELYSYLGGTIRGLGGVAEGVGGVADHVHLLVSLKTNLAPSDFVREVKKATSVWGAGRVKGFGWQEGYAVFSVSWSQVPAVRRYIETQEEHHRRQPFVAELKRLLERNGVAYDPQYLE